MASGVKIPGVEKDFGGGRIYLVPPLSLGALQLLQDKLAALSALTATDPVAVRTMIEATHLALRRNYPDITEAEVAELVDVANIGDVYECLMDVGGVRRKAQEAERSGNSQAGSAPTGTSSSPTSVPTPAGGGTTSAST